MLLLIIIIILTLVILYCIFKPYFIRYHTTLLLTGELGAGKTMEGVKTAVRVFKKTRLRIKIHNWWIRRLNGIIKRHNTRVQNHNIKVYESKKKKGKYHKAWNERQEQTLPRLISNIPIRIRKGKHEEWSNVLEKEMLTFTKIEDITKKIPEYSVVFIDEIPQLIDQYNWNLKEIQENVNEFITFFRHYINGLLIMTAQSDSQVVKQIRDKMNQFYWLSNFHRFLFIFYKFDVCQFISSDVAQNVNLGFIEENTKTRYGIIKKGLYDSRCYSERYTTIPEYEHYKRWAKYKTNKIIRFDNYHSPLDKE